MARFDRLGTHARRVTFATLVIASTVMATLLISAALQEGGISPLEFTLLVLYTVLFAWICASFWMATIGFVLLLFRVRRFDITRRTRLQGATALPGDLSRTAILMPVYNEDPQRVYAGLRAIWESLAATGEGRAFDMFILSDTRDPDIWVEEELRWRELCLATGGGGRIFYRNRPENTGRKAGNIKDFVCRWGARYRYMIVLDADSVMSGDTLVQMVRLMDRDPRVALIQVPPLPVNHESLFARILQFAGSLYGRMYTAGLNFWQAGEGNYWGHNAIIRIEPFAQHCGLPKLPGQEPFGGEILSHDFVEAALLRRAGWKLWLAHDLEGSYEELPPTLIDYAKRDRRWCQGNLQHLRLIVARGLHPVHRVHLAMGVMSYLASPLWAAFLLVTGIEAYVKSRVEPVYFFGQNLFPVWPASYTVQMTTVLAVTLAMLFLPKLYALILLLFDPPRRRQFGGLLHATASVILETLFSTLLAPVLMLFQTKFVFAILMRRAVGWPTQQRGDRATGFIEALQAHGGQTLIGVIAGVLTYLYVPSFFWWFTPVLAGMLLAVPLSMLASRVGAGLATRAQRLFLTPHETGRPPMLERLDELLEGDSRPAMPGTASGDLWQQAIRHPYVHALHRSVLPEVGPLTRRRRHHLDGLLYHLIDDSARDMAVGERRALIANPQHLGESHAAFWAQMPDARGGADPSIA